MAGIEDHPCSLGQRIEFASVRLTLAFVSNSRRSRTLDTYFAAVFLWKAEAALAWSSPNDMFKPETLSYSGGHFFRTAFIE